MFGPSPPAYSIGNSKREFSPEKPVPGPASYNISRDPIMRSVSFNRAKRHSKSKSEVPGPGSYTFSSSIGNAPHAIIISRKPEKSSLTHPGPADYTPRDSAHSIKYTMGSRSNSKIIQSIPGPGAYNNHGIAKNSPRATIGKASRNPENSEITPGPGSYDPKSVKPAVPKFSFPVTPRSDQLTDRHPGPGAYNIELSTNPGKPAVITPRRPLTANNGKTPGPGTYNVDVDHFHVPKWTISKAKRGASLSEIVPSVTDYSPKNVTVNMPAYSIGNSKRSEKNAVVDNPGPGAYETRKESSAPKFTIALKHEAVTNEAGPGPGQYNQSVGYKKKSPSAVFGTSKKQSYTPRAGPGPADYGIDRQLRGPRFSFTRERRGTDKIRQVPGPGQYEIPHTIGTAKSSQSLNNTFV